MLPSLPAAAAAKFLGPTVRVIAPRGRAEIARPWEAPAVVMQGVPPEWAAFGAGGEGATAPWSVVIREADIPEGAAPPIAGATVECAERGFPPILGVSAVLRNGGLVHLTCYEGAR